MTQAASVASSATLSIEEFKKPDMSKVTTSRGAESVESSFAPDDFTFNASTFTVPSFVFQPLSPNSAAKFLHPGQDNSCASFLECGPKRNSTPIRETRTSRSSLKTEDKSMHETIIHFSDQTTNKVGGVRRSSRLASRSNVADESALNLSSTLVEGASPSFSVQQSKRRSVSISHVESEATIIHLAKEVDAFEKNILEKEMAEVTENVQEISKSTRIEASGNREEAAAVEQEVLVTPRMSRKSRKSVMIIAPGDDVPTVGPTESRQAGLIPDKGLVIETTSCNSTVVSKAATPSILRKSKRRSVMTASEIAAEQVPTSITPQRSRRSVGSVLKGVDYSTPAATKDETPSSTRSKRRSIVSETMPEEHDESAPVTTSTPSMRRSSRKSVAIAPVVEEIAECVDGNQDQGQDMEMGPSEVVSSIPHVGPKSGEDTSDSNDEVFNDSLKENISPRRNVRTPKHIRNKSFGGFRLPSADSVVLSGKRKRKSMLPKSPEEWVQVLENSPMVEMTRRKPKHTNTSLPIMDLDEDILADTYLVSSDKAGPSNAVTCPSPVTRPVVSREEAVSSEVEPSVMDTEAASSEPCSKTTGTPVNHKETVQVEEITSTQSGSDGEETCSGEGTVYDVLYFRNLLVTETVRLRSLCQKWDLINTPDLTEEVQGQIRTTVGKAQLLMNQRFKQFEGLVDACEFNTGEKRTTCIDLKGFWDMVNIQVEDVNDKFDELTKRQARDWDHLTPKMLPVKVVKKKVKKAPVVKAGKSKFAAFRAQMKQKPQPVRSPGQKKTPKFNPRAGTPTKKATPSTPTGKPASTENTPASSEHTQVTQDTKETLALPATNTQRFAGVRTPARKSYVPVVPSPLLQDTTPAPRPTRTCTQKTPKRPLEDEDMITSDCKRLKATPGRGLRPRRSVNFSEEAPASPAVGALDPEMARLLQPTVIESPGSDTDILRYLQPTESTSNTDNVMGGQEDDIFAKYLQPQENEEKTSKGRRSSLKGCRSTERRRSKSAAVHFSGSSDEEASHMKFPRTPYNRDSIAKPRRSIRRSSIVQKNDDDDDDIFSINNIDNNENIPPPSFRSPRPSLLGTPPNMNRSRKVNRDVPTATLISFTP
ncbi:uncharacterized protein LOC127863119 isoform X2 [Dreissena polymorpha]|uniref:uncharacterized protein LOC127863119 isoform X2 n=1 Tax=Dreissena polymorpha TaxID=45954 RepID=UPI0022642740|nr:uncharacterized protein LOC127863119 isoform X2 [Dreissena polymorpha]